MGFSVWTGHAKRRPAAHLAAVRLIAVAVALAAFTLIPTAAEAIEGLQVDASTTYRVDPAAGTVHVRVEAHLTNTEPSQTSGAYIRTPYFDLFGIPVLGPVQGVHARSSGGGDLAVDIENNHGLTMLLVDLSPNLVHGTPQTITVDFQLPGQSPRSKSVNRVNAAFAGWFVSGSGDPGKIDITIDVPKSFDLSLSKNISATAVPRRGRRLYQMTRVTNPDDARFFASASDDDRLSTRRLEAAGTDVTIKAWPGDAQWQRFAARWVRRGLPVLEDLAGLEVPRDRLTVLESSRAYHLGYAGTYIPALGVVEVGDVLDESVMLHELAHMWANDDLFTQRWIAEGLAETMANRALAQLGDKPRAPEAIRRDAAGAVRLNAWSAAGPLEPAPPNVDEFGYNASYALVHEVTDEIGIDGLRKVLAAAAERRPAYELDTVEAGKTTVRDWRYFYDLVELVGGSDKVERLFRDHVLDAYERSLLRSRGKARERFGNLTAAGNGWSPPLQVRHAMGNWSFEGVDRMIGDAEALLKRAQSLMDDFTAAGIDAEDRLKTEYENAGSLTGLAAILDDYGRAADDIGAVTRRAAAAGAVARVGLLGADLRFDDAQRAIGAGDLDEVPPLLHTATATLDDASQRGIAIVVAVVLLCVVVGAHIARKRA